MAEDQGNLRLIRIYLKDASFESPTAPDTFKIKAEPAIDLAMSVAVRPISVDHYEVVLTGNVTARADGVTMFLCEAQQAGLFRARDYEGEELQRRLHVFCPKQLFPFLRETLANLTMKGGFPPVLISLVDFGELYRSRKQPAQA
jgi:preprotein translocase subunit SecB